MAPVSNLFAYVINLVSHFGAMSFKYTCKKGMLCNNVDGVQSHLYGLLEIALSPL